MRRLPVRAAVWTCRDASGESRCQGAGGRTDTSFPATMPTWQPSRFRAAVRCVAELLHCGTRGHAHSRARPGTRPGTRPSRRRQGGAVVSRRLQCPAHGVYCRRTASPGAEGLIVLSRGPRGVESRASAPRARPARLAGADRPSGPPAGRCHGRGIINGAEAPSSLRRGPGSDRDCGAWRNRWGRVPPLSSSPSQTTVHDPSGPSPPGRAGGH